MKVIVLISLLLPLVCSAGVMNGGGGKGVVCRDSKKEIISVELLDLWEARTLYGETPSLVASELEQGVLTGIERLKDSYYLSSSPVSGSSSSCHDQDCMAVFLKNNAKPFLSSSDPSILRLHGVDLTLTDDSYEAARPSNCAIEQIVNYQQGAKILINQDLYERLDLRNQIALILHESYYSMLRGSAGETNSVRTRRAIGYVMSNHSFEREQFPSMVPPGHLICYNNALPYVPTAVYLWPLRDKDGKYQGARFYPRMSMGTLFIGNTSMTDYPAMSESEFKTLASGKCSPDGFFGKLIHILNGPVEFDREVSLEFHCKNGVINGYLTDRKPGLADEQSVDLKCEFR